MIKSKSYRIKLVWIITLLLIVLSCKFTEKTFELNEEFELNKEINLNEEFSLKKDETIRVNQTNLRIKLIGSGQDISESGGSSYCNIELNYNEEYDEREVSIGESTTYDKYSIKVIAVDEKGGAKSSGTNCTFLVKRK